MMENRDSERSAVQHSVPRKSRRYSFLLLFIFVAGLFVISMGFHIVQYTRVLATSEEIHQLEQQLNELKDRRNRLEMRKSELYDLVTIYEMAREEGMVYPPSDQIHWLQVQDDNWDKR